MFIANTRNLVIIGAVVVAGALGAVGWMRTRDRSVGNAYPAGFISSQTPYPGDLSQPGPQSTPQSVQPIYESDGYYPTRMRPIYIHQRAPMEITESAPRRVVYEEEYYTDSHGRHRGRSKAHSVEIVAGTAAAGAVIGALAGGGQGAAIGAASGAGAGFVYDRLTHKH